MGLLRDIRNGASEPGGGWGAAGAVLFWAIVGGALGFGLATALNLPATATSVLIGIGLVLGFCLGFYAGLGTTTLARILSLPGVILELLH
ncbi:MAG TPA: hypothetical protein VK430_01300 [Xanthobacteraceae bacterium]|nr:hypothetical protein [Xanthobacteraceae bacterium]